MSIDFRLHCDSFGIKNKQTFFFIFLGYNSRWNSDKFGFYIVSVFDEGQVIVCKRCELLFHEVSEKREKSEKREMRMRMSLVRKESERATWWRPRWLFWEYMSTCKMSRKLPLRMSLLQWYDYYFITYPAIRTSRNKRNTVGTFSTVLVFDLFKYTWADCYLCLGGLSCDSFGVK